MVVHILGKSLPGTALLDYALASKIFGVGLKTSRELCAKLGFYPKMRVHQLTENQVLSITKELSEMTVEGKLKTILRENIQAKKDLGRYSGLRHALGLPVRGQRTKTNAQTAKRLNRYLAHR
ncbi:unnamed protein product [Kuraishia capsulata CBS 1993]|uniref:Small ribosomal subunit protein uS13m n=1 Tax=Kuraishia capsulata CBS 1993 TaxID=1382522 RepID=W6MMD2_9ASCO|nr:uncharacterized protein KUCA_T00002033001 [Kuraishia capsulata CBS 1993]CDK26062.1 unnamed protein product [Kuraishia capsulata CBS 1993]